MAEALYPGGAERQVHMVMQGLNPEKFDPHLITWQKSNFMCDEKMNFAWQEYPRKYKFDFAPVFQAAKMLKSKKVDIIHGILNTGNLYAFLATRMAKRGVFVASERSSKRKLSFFQKIHKPLSHKNADITIANSLAGVNFIRDLGIPKNRVVCIRNGLDMQQFQKVKSNKKKQIRAHLGVSEEKKLLLSVGRIIQLKNQLGIIEAIAKLRLTNIIVYLIGNASSDYFLTINKTIKEFSLTNVIRILPAQQNIQHWYQAADGLLLNSNIEGSPNVVMEALSCELPVIATNVGDVSYYLDDSCGWLIKPGNSETLVKALEFFSKASCNQLKRMGNNGREKLIKIGAGKKTMILNHESLYLKLLNKE